VINSHQQNQQNSNQQNSNLLNSNRQFMDDRFNRMAAPTHPPTFVIWFYHTSGDAFRISVIPGPQVNT
jgi:hypothetical protein